MVCTDSSLSTLTADGDDDNDSRASLVSREQLLQRISLSISAGGLGVRPVHRIRHAGYFASLLQMLPDCLRTHPEMQSAHSGSSDDSATVAPAYPSIQLFAELALTEDIEHTMYEQCFASCGAYQQAILRSLSEHIDCAWLTVLPTEPVYRLRDEQSRLGRRS